MYYDFMNIFDLIESIIPIFFLSGIEFIFRIVIITYIAKDAQIKNSNPVLWCLFTFFFPLIAVIFYLILVYKKPIINKNNINIEESKNINISQFNNSNNFNNIDIIYKTKKPTLLITFLVFEIVSLIVSFFTSFWVMFNTIEDIVKYNFYNNNNAIYNSFEYDDFGD